MKLNYIESNIGKKKLKEIKRVDLFYLISFILITINYIVICLDIKKITGIIVFTIIYIIIAILIRLIRKKHTTKMMTEILLKDICVDGFINMHIYNAKKAEKKLNNPRVYQVYNYSLLNIIDGYLRKGNYEQANDIIKALEKQKVDNMQKAFLIKYKATIAYNDNNKEEFDIQYENFLKIANSINEKIKNQILNSLDIQKNILENNVSATNKICDQLLNNQLLLNKIMGSYYKGVILEKNNNEEYKKYYKFVAENGNNLIIAKKAGEKIGIEPQVKKQKKKHLVSKFFASLFLIILIFITIFVCVFGVENIKPKKWDTGIVYINNTKIELPCTISEFEKNMNVEIEVDKIDTLGSYELYLIQNNLSIGDYNIVSGKYIELEIEGDVIKGIKIDISNSWNNDLDEELGNMVVFPGGITANSKIEEIQQAYKTGIINSPMREWSEEIVDDRTNTTQYSYGFKYSGNKYDISIDTKDGKVHSIYIYAK